MMLQDLAILQTIPGYAAIFKAVVKAQIQVLVEQLHEQAGEETLILTACMKEGTLCHLGSSRGQGFLSSRDDIKSQFLAYCQQDILPLNTSQLLAPLNNRNLIATATATPTVLTSAKPTHVQENKPLQNVSLEWAKTAPKQGVTIIKNHPKNLTILGNSVIDTELVGNGQMGRSVSLLQNPSSNAGSGLLHSIVIGNGNQPSVIESRVESNIAVNCESNPYSDSRLEASPFTSTENVLRNSEIPSVSLLENTDDRIIMCETLKPSSVDVKDKNKKTLSSKIDEITERIKIKDESHKVWVDDSSLDQPAMDITDIGVDSQLKSTEKNMDFTHEASTSKLKDVSRASHRKPKQPRFNIGVASDDEDNEASEITSDAAVTDHILNITDLTVTMEDSDSTFTPLNLDDLGDGVLLTENLTDIPIVEYSSREENKTITVTEASPVSKVKLSTGRKPTSKRLSHDIRVCGSNIEKKWFKCWMCPEKFTSQDMLDRHLETAVHMPKKCVCDLCGRTFGQLRDMERHRRIHTGEKPFTCDICNRSFARKDNLKSHKVNHLRNQIKVQDESLL